MVFNGLGQTPTETGYYARLVYLQSLPVEGGGGGDALGGVASIASKEDPPILRLTERRDLLNSHYFHMVKIPRLTAHKPTNRIHLTLLEGPALGTVDDPLRSPFGE